MTSKRPRPPLDEDSLRDAALRYVSRFATSRGKLLAYLQRKIRECGWGGEQPADLPALVDRLAGLGYVDDSQYAVMKSAASEPKTLLYLSALTLLSMASGSVTAAVSRSMGTKDGRCMESLMDCVM